MITDADHKLPDIALDIFTTCKILFFFIFCKIQKYLNKSDDFAYFLYQNAVRLRKNSQYFFLFCMFTAAAEMWNEPINCYYNTSRRWLWFPFSLQYIHHSEGERKICAYSPFMDVTLQLINAVNTASTKWKSILVCQKKLLFQWSILQGKRLIFLTRKKKSVSPFFWLEVFF